jgi:hypothetical protein
MSSPSKYRGGLCISLGDVAQLMIERDTTNSGACGERRDYTGAEMSVREPNPFLLQREYE